MEPTRDLDAALRLIVGRIEEQSTRSSRPLNEEQRLLLRYLPTRPTPYTRTEIVKLVPRNLDLERLCALAKEARSNDRTISPSSLDWEFALAVFNLNRHPMAGVLLQAGVKYRKPWWDRFLLVVAALLVIAGVMVPIFLLGIWDQPSYQLVACFVGFAVALAAVYFSYRRMEDSQLQQEVERCRNQCRLMNIVAD